jgi:hypothetical protein
MFSCTSGSSETVSKLVELFDLRFAGSAGVSAAEPNKHNSGLIWRRISRLVKRMRHGDAFAAETAALPANRKSCSFSLFSSFPPSFETASSDRPGRATTLFVRIEKDCGILSNVLGRKK